MLTLSYLGESKKLKLQKGAVRLFIVRKPMSAIPEGFLHVPQLSPSQSLFQMTQAWKRSVFREHEIKRLEHAEIDPTSPEAWWFLYKDLFREEMATRKDMVQALKRLESRLSSGDDIVLFCYCKDPHQCHRGLIGEYMQERGFRVNFGTTKQVIVASKTQISQETQLSMFD